MSVVYQSGTYEIEGPFTPFYLNFGAFYLTQPTISEGGAVSSIGASINGATHFYGTLFNIDVSWPGSTGPWESGSNYPLWVTDHTLNIDVINQFSYLDGGGIIGVGTPGNIAVELGLPDGLTLEPVPLPAAGWLLLGALLLITGTRRIASYSSTIRNKPRRSYPGLPSTM